MIEYNKEQRVKYGAAGAVSAASSLIVERAAYKCAQKYNESQNDWFAKEHQNNFTNSGNTGTFVYNAKNYERIAFKSERDAMLFVNEMNKQGIDVVATPFKQNGQYLAEIAKQQPNTNEDARHIIDKFSSDNYVKVYAVDTVEVKREDKEAETINSLQNDVGSGLAQAIFKTSEFGSVGTAIYYFENVSSTLNGWSSDVSNKVATVYGNNTVVIDGKFVTDEKIKESVLKEHYARINDAYATVIDNKFKKLTPDAEAAQKVINNVYKQSYEVKVNGAATLNYKEKWSLGALDQYSKKINSDKIAINNKGVREAIATEKLSVLSEKEQQRTMELLQEKGLSITDLADSKVSDSIANKLGQEKREEALKAAMTANGASKMTKKEWEETYRKIRSSTGNNYEKFLKETFSLKERNKSFLKGTKEEAMLDMDENGSTLFDDLKNTSWLKDKDFLSGNMTAQKLVMINGEFLKHASKEGYIFIKANNEFDIQKLENLSSIELDKLGLTERTRDMLVDINKEGSFGKMADGSIMAVFSNGLGFVMKVDDNSEGYADIQQLTGYIRKGVNYVQQAYTETQKVINAGKQRIDALKNKHSQRVQSLQEKIKENGVKPRTEKVKRKDPPEASKRQLKRQEKYSAKMQKKANLVQKKQNSISAKMNRAIQKAKKKVADSWLGKAVQGVSKAVSAAVSTFLIYYFGIGAIGAFFIQVCALVAVLVIFLVDLLSGIFNIGNWFAPQTYEDTVAYALSQELLKQEDIFVATLAEMPKQAAEASSLEDMNFGFFGETAEQYAGHFNNLTYVPADKNFKINPFWQDNTCTGTNNTEYLSATKKWDGTHTYDISTNLNYYSLISYEKNGVDKLTLSDFSDDDVQKVQYGVSNGHTSNIKDILAMTDVMYQMEATDSDDSEEGLQSILGRSPAQLNIDAAGKWLGGWLKSIGDFFVNIWCAIVGEDANKYIEPITVNEVSYNTVHNYAFNLFEMSHQIYLYLDVEYCDTNKIIQDNAGNVLYSAKDGIDKFENDSEAVFGICPNPETKTFDIGYKYPNDKPEPYLIGESGQHWLDEDFYDITISVEDNYVSDPDTLCLWEGMYTASYPDPNDPQYKDKIEASPCWSSRTLPIEPMTFVFTADTEVGSEHIPFGTTRSINVGKDDTDEQANEKLNELKSLYPENEYYYIIEDDKSAKWVHRDFGMFDYNKDPQTTNIDRSSPATRPVYANGVQVGTQTDSYEYHVVKTHYVLTVTLVKTTTKLYSRDRCHGHDFTYCGGHISTHSQGNVFSVTNDQMAITGVADNDVVPVSLFDASSSDAKWRAYSKYGYDGDANEYQYLFDENYHEIVGKVNHREMKYDTALNASQSGGGKTILEDIYQGTAVSKGLNIIVDGVNAVNGWGDGVAVKDKNGNYIRFNNGEIETTGLMPNTDELYYCRDIFDIDCIIYKGNNILPYRDYTKYEGWTADNMLLVCNRMQLDWYDTYGFDIATEIGEYNYALSEQDIEMLSVGLQASYPYREGGLIYNPEYEKAIQALLRKVGRGHYTVHEHAIPEDMRSHISYLDNPSNDILPNHGYLSFTCYSNTSYKSKDKNGIVKNIRFSGSCEAGNSVDIGWYAVNAAEKKKGRFDLSSLSDKFVGVNSPIIKPLEVIYHQPFDFESNYDESSHTITLDCNIGDIEINGYDLYNYHLNEQTAIVIGAITPEGIQAMKDWLGEQGLKEEELAYYTCAADSPDEDTQGMANTVMLSTGAYVTSNIPLIVDLNQMGIYTGLLLRSQADMSAGASDLGAFLNNYKTGESNAPDIREQTNNAMRTNYYWVIYRASDDRILSNTLTIYLDF